MSNRVEFDGSGDGVEAGEVHFSGGTNIDYTLCGLTMDGDEKTGGAFDNTNKKVNCPECIGMVEFCKTVKKNEYKKEA